LRNIRINKRDREKTDDLETLRKKGFLRNIRMNKRDRKKIEKLKTLRNIGFLRDEKFSRDWISKKTGYWHNHRGETNDCSILNDSIQVRDFENSGSPEKTIDDLGK